MNTTEQYSRSPHIVKDPETGITYFATSVPPFPYSDQQERKSENSPKKPDSSLLERILSSIGFNK